MDKLQIIGTIEQESIIEKRVGFDLFTIFELSHIYPNAKIVKGYFVIDNENYFSIENYEYLLNSSSFGGPDRIYVQCRFRNKNFLSDGTLCFFLKCPYPDIFINTGIYVYPWMIKHLRYVSGRSIYKATFIEDKTFLKMTENNNFTFINEYPDGYQLNF